MRQSNCRPTKVGLTPDWFLCVELFSINVIIGKPAFGARHTPSERLQRRNQLPPCRRIVPYTSEMRCGSALSHHIHRDTIYMATGGKDVAAN